MTDVNRVPPSDLDHAPRRRSEAGRRLEDSPHNGHYDKVTKEASTWASAQLDAMVANGDRATVRSEEESDWLLETFGAHEVYLWIGVRDTGHEGDFEWVSGEPFDESKSGTYEKWRGRFEQLLTS